MKLRYLFLAAMMGISSLAFSANKTIPNIVQITAENNEEVLHSSKLLIVDVYTNWCPPCKNLAPIYDQLSKEYGHLYQFAKLNADEQKHVADKYDITGFPTILFIKDGKLKGRHVGFMNKEKFLEEIQHYLK